MVYKPPKKVKAVWGTDLKAKVNEMLVELGEDLSQRNLIVHQGNNDTCEGYIKYLEDGVWPKKGELDREIRLTVDECVI